MVEISHGGQEQKLFYSHKLIKKNRMRKKKFEKIWGQEMIFFGFAFLNIGGCFLLE
jgi:hypothetical protein